MKMLMLRALLMMVKMAEAMRYGLGLRVLGYVRVWFARECVARKIYPLLA